MDVESTSTFEILVERRSKVELKVQQLLTFSERFLAASGHSAIQR